MKNKAKIVKAKYRNGESGEIENEKAAACSGHLLGSIENGITWAGGNRSAVASRQHQHLFALVTAAAIWHGKSAKRSAATMKKNNGVKYQKSGERRQ